MNTVSFKLLSLFAMCVQIRETHTISGYGLQIFCNGGGIYGVGYQTAKTTGVKVSQYSLELMEHSYLSHTWKQKCRFTGQLTKPFRCPLLNFDSSNYTEMYLYGWKTFSARLMVYFTGSAVKSITKTFSLVTCPIFELEQPKIKLESLNQGFAIKMETPKGWGLAQLYKSLSLKLMYQKNSFLSTTKILYEPIHADMKNVTMTVTGLSVFSKYVVQLDVQSESDPASIHFQQMHFTIRTSDAAPYYIPEIKTKSSQVGDFFKVTLMWNLPSNRSLNGDFKSYELQLRYFNTSWKKTVHIHHKFNTGYTFHKLHPGVKYEARLRVHNRHHVGNYSTILFGPYVLGSPEPIVWFQNPFFLAFLCILVALILLTLFFVFDGQRREKKNRQMQLSNNRLLLSPDGTLGYENIQEQGNYHVVSENDLSNGQISHV